MRSPDSYICLLGSREYQRSGVRTGLCFSFRMRGGSFAEVISMSDFKLEEISLFLARVVLEALCHVLLHFERDTQQKLAGRLSNQRASALHPRYPLIILSMQ